MLMNQKWLDASTLFVGNDALLQRARQDVHILCGELGYDAHVGTRQRLLSGVLEVSIRGRRRTARARFFAGLYGKTPKRVIIELHAYITQSSVRAAVFDIKLEKQELDPDVTDAPQLGVDLALADLLAAQQRNQQEALRRLQQIAVQHPESSDVQESLGYLLWVQGDQAKARDDFKLALDRGSNNAEMMNHYWPLLEQSGTPPDQILPVLRKSVELKPDNQDTWYNTGLQKCVRLRTARLWKRSPT